MVKKSSKVIAHYWIARPLIHHYVENLDLQGDFLYEGWSFLPQVSLHDFIVTTLVPFH